VQRKAFRIERMLTSRPPARLAGKSPDSVPAAAQPVDDSALQSLAAELGQLNDAVAHTMRELAALVGDGHERHMARAAGKLGAAIEGMEKATEKILKSAEVIDDSAKALAAAVKTDYETGLAQEIQDHVVKIYEACNFQDLSGQRIGNVIETLTAIEDQVEGMLDRHNGHPQPASAKAARADDLLNGPRLDGESGHTSQSDIDVLFD
jgi:chemotaxis protein CheZ